ncbi:nuclear transport factor 2 family protein [Stenotrophomonas tumulicola]|uniref:Nuclear transport factor 2 family protein n=1 Tax=Stenotrophomonas tumulicola TaxID=1685415 RepID=A0A7W3IGI3_9GAMM|nr:nuclear transport factor 2 family protein [Stenotrophomonas tumulicola]MBA8680960.1 nuclear transport factor 2 family protein [Stenotrophomonas tumulicola]
MTVSLPTSIADYFSLSNGDAGVGVEDCFTDDALVADEHQQHRGTAAIQSWLDHTRAQYDFQTVPLRVFADGDRTVVHARVTGNFPGGEVELAFAFVLQAAKIRRLDIQ